MSYNPNLSFAEYQAAAKETAIHPREAAIVYPALGLAGEAGEFADKLKQGMFPNGPPDAYDDALGSKVFWTLNSAAEAGRACELLKKAIRDGKWPEMVTPEALAKLKSRVDALPVELTVELIKEAGDQHWYNAAIATDLGVPMYHVAGMNLEKLRNRKAKGTLSGSGDNR